MVSARTQRVHSRSLKDRYVEDGRGFFCSELVAKAYKILGIIKNE